MKSLQGVGSIITRICDVTEEIVHDVTRVARFAVIMHENGMFGTISVGNFIRLPFDTCYETPTNPKDFARYVEKTLRIALKKPPYLNHILDRSNFVRPALEVFWYEFTYEGKDERGNDVFRYWVGFFTPEKKHPKLNWERAFELLKNLRSDFPLARIELHDGGTFTSGPLEALCPFCKSPVKEIKGDRVFFECGSVGETEGWDFGETKKDLIRVCIDGAHHKENVIKVVLGRELEESDIYNLKAIIPLYAAPFRVLWEIGGETEALALTICYDEDGKVINEIEADFDEIRIKLERVKTRINSVLEGF